ncbi:MAG: hypothetical protein JXA42_25240 [Anaerolineales bacterium]|nr:hypothetical protein [Anaerolineales bacterium]
MDNQLVAKRIRYLLWFFFVALLVSGLTAFPLQWELDILNNIVNSMAWLQEFWPDLTTWINRVHQGLTATYSSYPYLAYGTDWLAFAHIVIAIAFLGPIKDPVKNIWVIEFGMIACVLVIPLALICGHIRGIPWFWQLLDCSFGVLGIIPLWLVRNLVRRYQGA